MTKLKFIAALLLIPMLAWAGSSTTLIGNLLKGRPGLQLQNQSGTLSLPTSTDTLVGRATTDTLTNKTIDGGSNVLSNLNGSNITSGTVVIAHGGTGNTSFTNKSVPYYDSGTTKFAEDNSNFSWDSAAKKLTLGTNIVFNNPTATEFAIQGTVDDGWLRLTGGNSSSTGSQLYMYGNAAGGGDAGFAEFVLGGIVSQFNVWDHTSTNPWLSITDPGEVRINGDLTLKQLTAPSSPAAGYDKCYTKSDHKFYCKSSAGAESLIGPGVSGSGAFQSVLTKTTNYTILAGDFSATGMLLLKCNCSTACTQTLPAASNSGYIVKVKNIGTATCTVAAGGGDAIDDDTSFILSTHNDALEFDADGGIQWSVL